MTSNLREKAFDKKLPEYKSEFNLDQEIFRQIGEVVDTMDLICAKVRPPDSEINIVPKCVATERALYIKIASFLSDDIRELAEKRFDELDEQLNEFTKSITSKRALNGRPKIDIEIFKKIEKIQMFLHDAIQYSGIGVRLRKVEGWKPKLKRSLKG